MKEIKNNKSFQLKLDEDSINELDKTVYETPVTSTDSDKKLNTPVNFKMTHTKTLNRNAPYENIRKSDRITNPVPTYNKKLSSEIANQKALLDFEKKLPLFKQFIPKNQIGYGFFANWVPI